MRARAVQVMSRSLHAASRRPRRIGLPLPSSRSGRKANKNISSARAGKHQDAEQRGELKPGSELSPLAPKGKSVSISGLVARLWRSPYALRDTTSCDWPCRRQVATPASHWQWWPGGRKGRLPALWSTRIFDGRGSLIRSGFHGCFCQRVQHECTSLWPRHRSPRARSVPSEGTSSSPPWQPPSRWSGGRPAHRRSGRRCCSSL